MTMFKKATKEQSRLRVALDGVSGSGKTFTALTLAAVIAQGEPIAVIDTERGSASKYADLFDFDVLNLESYHPDRYIEAIHDAVGAGYAVLVIDSLTHAWSGKDGALELVDRAAKRTPSGNSFAAWRDVTPLHNRLVDAMIGADIHLIVTMRSKTEYTMVTNEKGKSEPRKMGLAPVQRDGIEYEFDIVGDMDINNTLVISKTRCPELTGGMFEKPDAKVGEIMLRWATTGAPATPRPSAPEPTPITKARAETPDSDPKMAEAVEAYAKLASNCQKLGLKIPGIAGMDAEAILNQYREYKGLYLEAKDARDAEKTAPKQQKPEPVAAGTAVGTDIDPSELPF